MEKKYVWLNINDGTFSNSWDKEDHKLINENMINRARQDGWKLIEYSCLTDDNFNFYGKMKIVYNEK